MTLTDYSPDTPFFYTLDIEPSLRNAAVGGLLHLEMIEELKANGKVFGYSIFAAQAATDKSTGKAYRNGRTFVYRCYDSDGDGKFEVMVVDSSPFLVPGWVT
jgi:hypothetical protein